MTGFGDRLRDGKIGLMRKGDQEKVREALRLAVTERRLWPAALLVSVGLSESWRALFGWDPIWAGERTAGKMSGASGLLLGVMTFFLSFLALRALGVLGEMVLIGQVSGLRETRHPLRVLRGSGRRFLPLALTYMPYELVRMAVIYLPSRAVYSWSRFDPRLRLWPVYLLFIGMWGALLLFTYGPAAILARLAARESVLHHAEPVMAWERGWKKFRRFPGGCFTAWLWNLLADVAFLLPAWFLAALLPWMGRGLGRLLGVPVIRVLPSIIFHMIMAMFLVAGQVVVQAFKSALWTGMWLEMEGVTEPGSSDTGHP